MENQVHYEIFRRAGAKGGWSLHEASSSRDGAIKIARELGKIGITPETGLKNIAA